MEALAGSDGRLRCRWGVSAPGAQRQDYQTYHDAEWGQRVTTTRGLYERLTLEAFQSGLAWITILRKRESFRSAFADFDPERVAKFGDADVTRLMGDAGIVRNTLKIDAAISNARVVAQMGEEFADLVLGYAQPDRPRPLTAAEVPAQTDASRHLAQTLRSHGIRFVGPTTAYALMQAVGLVDDHLRDCFVVVR